MSEEKTVDEVAKAPVVNGRELDRWPVLMPGGTAPAGWAKVRTSFEGEAEWVDWYARPGSD